MLTDTLKRDNYTIRETYKPKAMSQTEKYIQHDSRQHKTDEAEQYLEDRAQLLDTIREMINVEIDKRGGCMQGGAIPQKPPPEDEHRKLTFLQWLKNLI